MEPPSIPAGYVKSGALSRLPLFFFFFQELKLELREAPCLSTIIPTLTNSSPNTKSQLTLNFHREKRLNRTRLEEGESHIIFPLPRRLYPEKRNGICVHTKNFSAKPSINHYDSAFKRTTQERASETIPGFMSDFPKCRSHLQAAGGLGQEKLFWRCHCGKKIRNTLTLCIFQEAKDNPRVQGPASKKQGAGPLTFVQFSRNCS